MGSCAAQADKYTRTDGVTTAGHLICDSGLFYSRVQACWRHNGVWAYTAKLPNQHFVLNGKPRTQCVQLGPNHD